MPDWLDFTVVVLSPVAIYFFRCLIFPYGKCRKCEGAGIFSSKSGNHFRLCPKCGGERKRLRLGRRILSHLFGGAG